MRVVISKDLCISCGSCWTLCPEVFDMSGEDARSVINENYRISEDESLGEVSKELEECVEIAKSTCPTSAIQVYE